MHSPQPKHNYLITYCFILFGIILGLTGLQEARADVVYTVCEVEEVYEYGIEITTIDYNSTITEDNISISAPYLSYLGTDTELCPTGNTDSDDEEHSPAGVPSKKKKNDNDNPSTKDPCTAYFEAALDVIASIKELNGEHLSTIENIHETKAWLDLIPILKNDSRFRIISKIVDLPNRMLATTTFGLVNGKYEFTIYNDYRISYFASTRAKIRNSFHEYFAHVYLEYIWYETPQSHPVHEFLTKEVNKRLREEIPGNIKESVRLEMALEGAQHEYLAENLDSINMALEELDAALGLPPLDEKEKELWGWLAVGDGTQAFAEAFPDYAKTGEYPFELLLLATQHGLLDNVDPTVGPEEYGECLEALNNFNGVNND